MTLGTLYKDEIEIKSKEFIKIQDAMVFVLDGITPLISAGFLDWIIDRNIKNKKKGFKLNGKYYNSIDLFSVFLNEAKLEDE